MPNSRWIMVSLCLVALASTACGGGRYVVEGDAQVYMLTNLHPDSRGRITSVNYVAPRGAQLLRMCTPVHIDQVVSRRITFTDQTTGQRMTYTLHRSTRAPIDQHLARYFGSSCPQLGTMSAEDQSGIQQGQVFQGMTKQGVVLALGYPPEHRTPTLEGDVWRYWSSGRRQFEVHFTNGLVSGVTQ